ncbi:hypothetical protein D5R81_03835 [Parashewanella spongiae]|uniref:Uncharacterized protein n=1 Tax=Parashewanella spongiae TaxID=342950 RepID=A0A3A6U3T4_9GAMM|nr:hypothetical protein [Parashewanella spongiae]MCL1077057.1 hypothetical protein [Parashewanella spongiae]RJY18729.1 hypothetical protein D5R81_03835 [Parashewanella spongiae]
MALTSTSNTASGVIYDTPSSSNNANKSSRKRPRAEEGKVGSKKSRITTAASKCYLVSQDNKLPQELQDTMDSKGIKVAPAFTKLLSKVKVQSEEQQAQYSNKLTLFFKKIADTKVIDTSFFTSMINEGKIKKFFSFSDSHIAQVAQTNPMKPLSSIFHRYGLPNEAEITRFFELLKRPELYEDGVLSLSLLRSLSSIFNGRGLPNEAEIERFFELLERPQMQEDGKLSLPRIKSISSMFRGRGLPDEAEMTKVLELLELPQFQDGGKLSLPRLKSMSSIFNGCGQPDKVEMDRFTELLELPQLQEGGTLKLPLLKSLSSILNGHGLPDGVTVTRLIKLLELPQLQQNGKLSVPLLKSLSSILSSFGLPDEADITRFIEIVKLPQLQEGDALNLPLFKSLSSIFSGQGLPDETEMKHFFQLLELPQLQEGGKISLPLLKSLSSIYHGCCLPDKTEIESFIKLLKLPLLQMDGTLSLPLLKSLSSIFNGRGLPDEVAMEHFIKILELPQLQENGRLSLPLFKSLSSILNARGLPDKVEMDRFIELLELPKLQMGGTLSLPLLKSLSSIFHGHGLPNEAEMKRFIELLKLPQLQEGGTLSLPLLKSLSSIFNCRGLPNEAEMKRFIQLLKMPQLQDGDRLSLPLFKSLSSIFNGRGLPDDASMKRFIELLELPQLQQGGRLSQPLFKKLSSIFRGCGLPNETDMKRFIELLELPQLQQDGRLTLLLFKSLSLIFHRRGLPDEVSMTCIVKLLKLPHLHEGRKLNLHLYMLIFVKMMSRPVNADSWFNLLEDSALQKNGRIHLLRLACAFAVFSVPPTVDEITKLFSLLNIDGQPNDQLLKLCIHEWKQSSLKAVKKAFSCSPIAELITHFRDKGNDELISLKALALTIKGELELLENLRNYCLLNSSEITGLSLPCSIKIHQRILSALGKICFANGQLGLKLFFANAPRPEGNRPLGDEEVRKFSCWEQLLCKPINKTILSCALDLKNQNHESVRHYFHFCRVTRSCPTSTQWVNALYPIVLKGVNIKSLNQVQVYLIAASLFSFVLKTEIFFNDINCWLVLCKVFSTANDLHQLSILLPAKKFYTLCLAGKDYGQYLNAAVKPKEKTMNTLNFGLAIRGVVLPVKYPRTINAVTFYVLSNSMDTNKGVTLLTDKQSQQTDCPMVLFCYWFSLSFASAHTPYHINQDDIRLLNIDDEVIELPFPQLSLSTQNSITISNWSADELSLFINTLISDFPAEFANNCPQAVVSTDVIQRNEPLSQKQAPRATNNKQAQQEIWLDIDMIEKCIQSGLLLTSEVHRSIVYHADSLSSPTLKALLEKYSFCDVPSQLRERLGSSVQYKNIPFTSWHHDGAATNDTEQEFEPMDTSASQGGEDEAILSLMDDDDLSGTTSLSKDNQPVQLSEFSEEWQSGLLVDLSIANSHPILNKPQLDSKDVEMLLDRIEEFTLSELTIMLSRMGSDIDSTLVKRLDEAYDIQQQTRLRFNAANYEDELSFMDIF